MNTLNDQRRHLGSAEEARPLDALACLIIGDAIASGVVKDFVIVRTDTGGSMNIKHILIPILFGAVPVLLVLLWALLTCHFYCGSAVPVELP